MCESLEGCRWLYRGVPIESSEVADVESIGEIHPPRPDRTGDYWRQAHSAGLMTETGYTSWSTDRALTEAAASACRMMIKIPREQSWLRAFAEAAKVRGVSLPSFTGHAMGGAGTARVEGGKFITFKRRMVPADRAGVEGVEWTLWREQDDLPVAVAAFREPLEPTEDDVNRVLSIFKGWLVDDWAANEAKAVVSTHPRVQPVPAPPLVSNEKSL